MLTERDLRRLQRLSLKSRRIRTGLMRGDRRSSRRGTSIEFADFRTYVPGDDLRRVDWNVYARLDRPYLKLLEEEEDLAVYVLVDGSASMDWGYHSANKLRYACQLAAGLAAIAIYSGDRVFAGILRDRVLARHWGPARGVPGLPHILEFLQQLIANGQTALTAALSDFLRTPRPPGLVILISDLFSPDEISSGIAAGARLIQQHGHDLAVLHVLSPEEIDPAFSGELRLVDVETGQAREVSLNPGLLALYRSHLENWIGALRLDFRRRGIQYVHTSTGIPWDRFVLFELRRAGLVQ